MLRSAKWLLVLLGFLLIVSYLGALKLGDLRQHTVEFEWLFFSAFALYGVACFIVLQADADAVDRGTLFGIFVLAALMQSVLIFSPPTLTIDMYLMSGMDEYKLMASARIAILRTRRN